ncbi:MAG: hypothetical protein RR802_06045 [Erysipelotrichaceae bacterium]
MEVLKEKGRSRYSFSKALYLSIEEVLKLRVEDSGVSELGQIVFQKNRRNICVKIIFIERRILMIDFTNCEVNIFKAYGGANKNKIN